MPFFRFSFWGRFIISLIVVAALFLSLYVVAAVVYSAPAPIVSAYNIAPKWTEAQADKKQQKLALSEAQKQAEAAQKANEAAKQTEIAKQNGISQQNELQVFFATADLNRGKRVFARCASCHTVNKGGMNRIGPNLWGINGRAVASHKGFKYSQGMKKYAENHPDWNLANLDRFIHSPKKEVPGTIMFYSGVKDLQERADLLLYLESLKD